MRLLLFSDLHCDHAAAQRLVQHASQADLVVGAGDFGSVRRGVAETVAVLRQLPCPVVFVAGNNESTEELQGACKGWPAVHVLHGSSVTLQGQVFFGLPGGIPVTPFGSWSYDFTEQQAEEWLRNCPAEAVLVSHSPPHGTADMASNRQHLGSVAVRDFILAQSPPLVVCGHIHASAGQAVRLGKTMVVNPGPLGILYDLATGTVLRQ